MISDRETGSIPEMEGSFAPIWSLGLNSLGQILTCSPDWCHFWGQSETELCKLTVYDLFDHFEPTFIELQSTKPYQWFYLTMGEKRFSAYFLPSHQDSNHYQLVIETPLHNSQQSMLTSLALDMSRQGFFVLDAQSKDFSLVYCNQPFAEMFGYKSQDLICNNLSLFWGEETDLKLIQRIFRCFSESSNFKDEIVFYCKNGNYFLVLLELNPYFDSEGRLLYYLGLCCDITQEHELYEEITYRQDLLHEAQEMAQLGVFDWDVSADYVFWTPKMYDISGLDIQSFEPRLEGFYKWVHPEDLSRVQAVIAHALKTASNFSLDYRQITPDGEIIFIHTKGKVHTDQTGCATRVYGVSQNITETKNLYIQLTERALRLERFLNASPDGIVIVNAEGQICYVNQKVEEYFQYNWHELNGKKIEYLLPKRYRQKHFSYRKQFEEQILTGQTDWELIKPRLLGLRRDGEEFPVEINLNQIDYGGEVQTIATIRDVSALRKAEQEIIALNIGLEQKVEQRSAELHRTNQALLESIQQAELANQAKSVFLASMSHEIRTPLNAILGFAQLLEMSEGFTEHQYNQIKSILASGDHLLGLINEVLDLARIESGQVELKFEDFYIETLLEEMQRMFVQRFMQKDLAFHCEIKGKSSVCIRSDYDRLKQIIINLLGNAYKFTEQGNVTLRLQSLHEQGEFFLRIEVEDTGIGVEASENQVIFEDYGQAEAGQNRLDSTGLGLSLCRKYALLLKGQIGIESEPGKGSLFWLQIPVSEGLEPLVKPDRSLEQRRLNPEQAAPRILIVDDVESNRFLLLDFLQRVGFIVASATGGREAIKMIAEQSFDLVLLDIGMPEVSGYDVLKSLEKTSPKPIMVAVTASAFDEERKKILSLGADVFFAKPFKFPSLLDLLAKSLDLEYINVTVSRKTGATSEPLLSQAAQDMPLSKEWKDLMLMALEQCDSETIYQLLQELEAAQIHLKNEIEHNMQLFDYHSIQELLKKYGS